MKRVLDDIRVLERAYTLRPSMVEWLGGIHDALLPYLDRGYGVSVGSWAVEGGRFTELSPPQGSMSPEMVIMLQRLVSLMPEQLVRRHYGPEATDFIGSTSQVWPEGRAILRSLCRERGLEQIREVIGLLVLGNPGRNGIVVNTFAPEGDYFGGGLRKRLFRLLAHLSAGFRLRLAVQNEGLTPEAILSPSGKVELARGEAAGDAAINVIREAVENIEKSRGRLRRTDPEEALSLWRGLVDGRWSIVDWVDTDSRRYLVAYANPRSARDPRALTPRELDVAEYLVQGRSKSEIAYALGLGLGTVSRISRDVLRKLGGARRTDLAAIFGAVAPFRASVTRDGSVQVLGPGSNGPLWDRLTRSEREVVREVLSGSDAAEVARRRNVSMKTISNQLGQVYARFGVRGRTELAALLGAPH